MSYFILGFITAIVIGTIFKAMHRKIKQCILRFRWKISKKKCIQKTNAFDKNLLENSIKIIEKNYIQ